MRVQDIVVFGFCFVVLEAVALINAYVINLKGATVDAERFIEHAIDWTISGKLEFVTNAEFFIQFLGIIFLIFGPSEFIATQFGLVALLISGVYFVRMGNLFGIVIPSWAIAAFFLWPSLLVRVTTTMREPYLILFIVLICFYAARYRISKNGHDVAKILIISFMALLFHKAFAILAVSALVYTVFFVMKQRASWFKSRTFYLRLIISTAGAGGVAALFFGFSDVRGLQPLIALLSADSEYITRVLDWKSSREFRSTYDAVLDFSSPTAFAISVPKVFSYYMFSPFPWQISAPLDILASIEGLFRFGALWLLAKYVVHKKRFPPASYPVFILVMMLVFVWAAGTSNYGTASRHHITTNWAFIFVYVLWLKMPTVSRNFWNTTTLRKNVARVGAT